MELITLGLNLTESTSRVETSQENGKTVRTNITLYPTLDKLKLRVHLGRSGMFDIDLNSAIESAMRSDDSIKKFVEEYSGMTFDDVLKSLA